MPVLAANTPDDSALFEHVESNYTRYLDLQIEIAEIPAPPFKETKRARFIAEQFRASGLDDVSIDEAGNVIGWRYGTSGGALALCAHLDTVFPEGTDVSVRKQGARLYGPGLADNGAGLTALIAVADALESTDRQLKTNLLFVASVGEEGLGDLRGVRAVFSDEQLSRQIDAFIAVDGSRPDEIVGGAVGSKRYKVTIRGPGGHSFENFGRVNAAHALGHVISKLASMTTPDQTTYNVGRIGGGTSVNAIPSEVWMEVDLRSGSAEALNELDEQFRSLLESGIAQENAFRKASGTELSVSVDQVGDRPGGATSEDDPLFVSAFHATTTLGFDPVVTSKSTDANMPMSLGIPAIAIGGGGYGGNLHSPDEWYEPEFGALGIKRLLRTIVLYDETSNP